MSANKYNSFYHHNIVEITGIPAIGKSTYIKENYVDNDNILFDVWSGPQVKDSISYELRCTLVYFSLY